MTALLSEGAGRYFSWLAVRAPVLRYRVVFRAAQAGLGRPHQFQRGGQPQAALARQRNGFEFSARFIAGAGKADADLMAAEHGVFTLGRRVLLVEELPPFQRPSAEE